MVDLYPSHDCTFVQPYPYYGTACIPRLLCIYACTSPNCPRHCHLLLHFGALPSLLFSLLGRHPHASQRLLIFYDEATHGNLRLEDILRTLRNWLEQSNSPLYQMTFSYHQWTIYFTGISQSLDGIFVSILTAVHLFAHSVLHQES